MIDIQISVLFLYTSNKKLKLEDNITAPEYKLLRDKANKSCVGLCTEN